MQLHQLEIFLCKFLWMLEDGKWLPPPLPHTTPNSFAASKPFTTNRQHPLPWITLPPSVKSGRADEIFELALADPRAPPDHGAKLQTQAPGYCMYV